MEIRRANLANIVSADAVFERVAAGFDFIEGPLWHPGERSVIFSDILGNSLYRWSRANGLEKIRSHSYMANGNAYDRQGRVVTCEHATSRLTRTDFRRGTGPEILATHYQGQQLNSPNDVIVKKDGAIYFTDPTSGRSREFGIPREPELPFCGVYRLEPVSGELTLLLDDFAKPNGLCFSRDETLLYVSDTTRQHIRVFDVQADGTVSNGRLFAALSGDEPGAADGLKVDGRDRVFSCGPGGIHVFLPNGEGLGVIETPEYAANFVFGDDDLCSLYITAQSSLYRLRLKVPGHPTYQG